MNPGAYGSSPLTGLPLVEQTMYQHGFSYYVGEPIGQWAITNFAADQGFFSNRGFENEGFTLAAKQLKRVHALLAGKAFEAGHNDSKPPMTMTNAGRASLQARGELNGADYFAWRVWTIEDLWEEARGLTMKDKSLRTLATLANLEDEMGVGVALSLSLGQISGRVLDPTTTFPTPIGVFYGCSTPEIPFAAEFLLEQKFIRFGAQAEAGLRIFLTPLGYDTVAKMSAGDVAITRTAFLICRFTPELDEIYNTVYRPTGELADIRCPIYRVKDVHHVDKIDDRILQELKASTVVVVDLTNQNFNVAFEAGYALALGKPIVWTLRRTNEELRLPFDIQSQNVLIWDDEFLDEFREALKFRIIAALEKARSQP